MKRLHLFEAVGLVDDHLVEEAADAKRSVSPWGRWMAAAACIALALSLGTAAAGTLLRGCGVSKSAQTEAAVENSAPASSESAPGGADEFAGEQDTDLAAPSAPAAPAEPECAPADAPPVPAPEKPAEIPAADNVDTPKESAMGSLQKGPPALRTSEAAVRITVLEDGADTGDGDGVWSARYSVENQNSEDRSVSLYFTLDTGGEGLAEDAVVIQVDGGTVSFDALEATVCPDAEGSLPPQDKRHFRIEFDAVIPARDTVEITIRCPMPAST